MARMTSVEAWDPALPPLEMMSGMNSASTVARPISPSKNASAVAVSISPTSSTASQPPRLRSISRRRDCRYGTSRASMPPNFWASSVASSCTTSTMSSTVTMPFITPPLSTIGITVRSCSANSRDSAS